MTQDAIGDDMNKDEAKKIENAMNALQFVKIVESYGSAASRWPEGLRKPAQAFTQDHPTAREIHKRASQLDMALDTLIAPAPSAILRARIMKAAHDLRLPKVLKAANDRLPLRAIAATLIVSAFVGFLSGSLPQFSGGLAYAETFNTDTEVHGIDEHLSYAWIQDTLSLDAESIEFGQ